MEVRVLEVLIWHHTERSLLVAESGLWAGRDLSETTRRLGRDASSLGGRRQVALGCIFLTTVVESGALTVSRIIKALAKASRQFLYTIGPENTHPLCGVVVTVTSANSSRRGTESAELTDPSSDSHTTSLLTKRAEGTIRAGVVLLLLETMG